MYSNQQQPGMTMAPQGGQQVLVGYPGQQQQLQQQQVVLMPVPMQQHQQHQQGQPHPHMMAVQGMQPPQGMQQQMQPMMMVAPHPQGAPGMPVMMQAPHPQQHQSLVSMVQLPQQQQPLQQHQHLAPLPQQGTAGHMAGGPGGSTSLHSHQTNSIHSLPGSGGMGGSLGSIGAGSSSGKVPSPSATLAQKVYLPKVRPFVDPNDKGPRQLLVNYVAKKVTEVELFTVFENAVGPCECAKLILDKQTGKTKGYGFVYFASSADAAKAIEVLRDYELFGKKLKVGFAVPQRPCLDTLSTSPSNSGTTAPLSQQAPVVTVPGGGGGATTIAQLRGQVSMAMLEDDY